MNRTSGLASSTTHKQHQQDQVRKLFRQSLEEKTTSPSSSSSSSSTSTSSLSGQTKKPISPFAIYTSSGTILCSLCNVSVKNEILWATHASGKKHKEMVAARNENTSKSSNNDIRVKRTAGYEDQNSNGQSVDVEVKKAKLSALPDDFFNSDLAAPMDSSNSTPSSTSSSATTASASSSSLPAGFFDDKDRDARERNVPTESENLDQEWEKFQQTILEDAVETEEKVNEEEDENWVAKEQERNSEHQSFVSKVSQLKELREQIKQTKPQQQQPQDNKDKNEDDDEDVDDEDDPDNMMNWRAKKML